GLVVGGSAVALRTRHQPRLVVVRGTVAWVRADGAWMSFKADRGQPRLAWGTNRYQGFGIAGVATQKADGSWSDEPVCVPPSSKGERLEVGVVRVAIPRGGSGREILAWVKCL